MTVKDNTLWEDIIEFARWAPTPHNTQPVRLKPLNGTEAELYYDNSRALPEGDPPARFAHAAIGILPRRLR